MWETRYTITFIEYWLASWVEYRKMGAPKWVPMVTFKEKRQKNPHLFHSASLSGPMYKVQHTEITMSRQPTSRPKDGAKLDHPMPHNCDRTAWRIGQKKKKKTNQNYIWRCATHQDSRYYQRIYQGERKFYYRGKARRGYSAISLYDSEM